MHLKASAHVLRSSSDWILNLVCLYIENAWGLLNLSVHNQKEKFVVPYSFV